VKEYRAFKVFPMGDDAGRTSPWISANESSLNCNKRCSIATLMSTSEPKVWLFCRSRTILETHQCFVFLCLSLIFFFRFSPYFTSFLSYFLHSFSFFLLILSFPIYFTLVAFSPLLLNFSFIPYLFIYLLIYLFIF
jgi:hypothetical protein